MARQWRLPPKAVFEVEVPPEAFRLVMRGKFMAALDMVFDYDNFEIYEVGVEGEWLIGTFATERGDFDMPLRKEYFGDQLQRLADAIKNNL